MVVQMLTPEESAARDLRIFSQIHPGTIFAYSTNDHQHEVAICKSRISDDKIEVAVIDLSIFDAAAKAQTLEFSEIQLINIQKEVSIEVSASQNWTFVSLRDKANYSNYKSLSHHPESDDFLDELKASFNVVDVQITSMGNSKLFTVAVATDIITITKFLLQRDWAELSNPPGFEWK
jgi:hypothetical protein